ncbi:MAG: DUF1501 domain-containing protein [Planctomycetaceae bacterium]
MLLPELQSRRDVLRGTACGFGSLALSALLAAESRGLSTSATPPLRDGLHHPARVKRVIFIFMQGGPSHVDSFDHKPLLAKRDGQQFAFEDDRIRAKTGQKSSTHKLMKSPWEFRQYGESGRWVSDLFPHVAQHVDQLCLVHSLHTEGVAHGPATLFLHCGATNFIRPSMGSWISYGLGSENRNLPSFVTIAPSAGNGGPRNYGTAFLPPRHQGTAIGDVNSPRLELDNLINSRWTIEQQREQLELTRALNQHQLQQHGGGAELDAVIESLELAWRMQSHAPELLELDGETVETHSLYGIGEQETDRFGRQCLLARRLCEAGVRYIQVNYGDNSANPAWDQHSNLPKHAEHARKVDRPIAGLLADLHRRGLLEDTLVWWGGEFGRTPYSQSNGTGRDHNPSGFTMWLAGGGVQSGLSYGRTDDFGHQAVENKIHMHDLHATILHLLGIDHLRLTYRYAGRDFRLTDVAGEVVHGLLS